jgi:hypothetical protein
LFCRANEIVIATSRAVKFCGTAAAQVSPTSGYRGSRPGWLLIVLHWLSSDPRSASTLNEVQEAELQLVGPLVAAGRDAELLARLLHGLRRA